MEIKSLPNVMFISDERRAVYKFVCVCVGVILCIRAENFPLRTTTYSKTVRISTELHNIMETIGRFAFMTWFFETNFVIFFFAHNFV